MIERTDDGIPYVRPEIVLLFKAKSVRAKDEDDFEAVVARLPGDRRARLAGWLGQVHPGHPWIQRVSGNS